MDNWPASELAEAWIARWSAPGAAASHPPAAGVLDRELPRSQPHLCLAAIVEVLARIDTASPNHLMSVLAAGPLEALLVHHGDAVVAEVELLARRDRGFRLLLNGVWASSINADTLGRLARYRTEPW